MKKLLDSEISREQVQLAEAINQFSGDYSPATSRHSRDVARLAAKAGAKLGLPRKACLLVYVTGLLHDVGKLAVPRSILEKGAPLTEPEWQTIAQHPRLGCERVVVPSGFPDCVGEAVLHHHERLDGSGYPHRLTGEELTFSSRLIALCDTVSAMSSSRPYRKAREEGQIVAELERCAGDKYDPELVQLVMEFITSDP
ncbi:MAG: HD-GYP domain-containing protein [Candidatus Acetothermia bacterium]